MDSRSYSEIFMNLWLLAGQMNLLEKLMTKKHFINASLAMKNNATINSCCDRVLFPLIFCGRSDPLYCIIK